MNAFLDYVAKSETAADKARQRTAEKRRATAAQKAAEKALRERDDLFRLYKKERRERLNALLAGPRGSAAQELVTFLKTITLTDEPRLIEAVRAGGWEHADANTRFEILALIDAAIIALRERAGLPPISDPLPGQPPSAFLILRELLR